MNDNFEEYIDRLKKLHYINPKKVTFELKKLVSKIESSNNSKNNLLDKENKELFAIVIVSIAIACIGLINLKSNFTPLYFFGLIFFLVGVFVTTMDDRKTLIFLFSHGGVGLLMMIGPIISKIMNLPMMNDGLNNIHLYIYISIMILFTAFIICIVRNLSYSFKEKRYSLLLPILLFFIGILMIVLLPQIYEFIYAL